VARLEPAPGAVPEPVCPASLSWTNRLAQCVEIFGKPAEAVICRLARVIDGGAQPVEVFGNSRDLSAQLGDRLADVFDLGARRNTRCARLYGQIDDNACAHANYQADRYRQCSKWRHPRRTGRRRPGHDNGRAYSDRRRPWYRHFVQPRLRTNTLEPLERLFCQSFIATRRSAPAAQPRLLRR
jgi:hypothetical protein